MDSKKNVEIGYRIIKILTSKFSFEEIDEEELNELISTPNGLTVDMNISLNINKETNDMIIDVSTVLLNTNDKKTLIHHVGRTSFNVKDLDKVFNEKTNAFDLPDDLLIQLYSISYTHSRALLATELNSTIYKEKYFLPVVNPQIFISKKLPTTMAKKS